MAKDSSYLQKICFDSSGVISFDFQEGFNGMLLVLFSSNLSSIAPINFNICPELNISFKLRCISYAEYMLHNSNFGHRKMNPIMSQMEKFSILRPSFFLLPTIFDPDPLQNSGLKTYQIFDRTFMTRSVNGLWIPTLTHCSFNQNPSHYSKSHLICLVNSELMSWCLGITDVILWRLYIIYYTILNWMFHIIWYYFFSSLAVCHSCFEHHTNSSSSYWYLMHFQLHYEKLQLVLLSFHKWLPILYYSHMIPWSREQINLRFFYLYECTALNSNMK